MVRRSRSSLVAELRITRAGAVARDWKFRDQIRDSVRSAPRNLSEGFARYNHGEFAYFANIAKGSFAETRNHLQDAKEENYLSCDDYARMDEIAEEALRTTNGLLRHLLTSEAPRPYWDVSALGNSPRPRKKRQLKGEKTQRRG
jgi:four helix bundle protein